MRSVLGRHGFCLKSVHGKNGWHYVLIPARKVPYRVHFRAVFVHGREGFGTKSVHGASGNGRGGREVYTVGTASGRKVYRLEPEGIVVGTTLL